ncbi:MAG: M23 family metallopeptidase [Smithella sp.]|nr:M23 family metallopeptidase [Smithella sp.]MDM7986104.1 M23 family metallopeptidase [Smithella sp.]HOU50995.1 M23 family metallopeptidase [Smithella sp.]HQG64202.1 M23 family metallopeptidase [Smithella sp.]
MMKRFPLYIEVIIGVLVLAVAGWFLFGSYLEMSKPVIKFDQEVKAIGRQKNITIHFDDSQSGLSRLSVEIIQDNKGQMLVDKKIPAKGIFQETLPLSISAGELKLHDGPATLKVTAADHSVFENKTVLSNEIKIDTVPPQIYLLKNTTYLNQGGTGFVAYQSSKPLASTGVYINNYLSPAHSKLISNKPSYVTYFALPMDASQAATRIVVFARDEAGNEANTAVPCVVKEKKFRSDKMSLSENFLQQKMPEFHPMVQSLQGKTLLDVFLYVNSQMRKDNFTTIQNICKKSASKELWEGPFLRMQNAAPMALFGDKRYYVFENKTISESVHEGVDLASNARSPIEAANSGIVVFTGALGIYGNAVIIDHGLGLFSLYGHLSSIDTTVGKNVAKGEKIGLSGMSGLAGGDHLHFGIMVSGQFVNPQEWWDAHWIQDNINL